MHFRRISLSRLPVAVLFFLIVSYLAPLRAFAQGIMPFKTIQDNGGDQVDLSTLNVVVSAPERVRPGGASVRLTINSVPFYAPGGGGEEHMGLVLWTDTGIDPRGCPNGQGTDDLYDFTYYDPTGGAHLFLPIRTDSSQCLGSWDILGPVTANDGSGYTMKLLSSNPYSVQVYDIHGGVFQYVPIPGSCVFNSCAYEPSYTDSNGNVISYSWTGGTYPKGFQTLTDMYSTVPVLAVGNTQNLVTAATYTDAAGNQQTISTTLQNTTGHSLFTACNIGTNTFYGFSPYSSISYPDGSSVGLTWEQWQYQGGTFYTGRLSSIKLRTGSTISYVYSGGYNNSGINCYVGETSTMTRTTPDGVWTYTNTFKQSNGLGFGGNYTTTVTDPGNNHTDYTFIYGFETKRQIYDASGTLLSTIKTCYNGATNCDTQTVVNAPITEVDKYTYPGSTTSPSVVKQTFNSLGLLTQIRRYDFGGTTPVSTGTITYGTWNGTVCAAIGNIADTPCLVTITDSNGAKMAETRYTYDTKGNGLTTSRWVSGSSYLTVSATHNSKGSVATVTDVNGAVTTYSNYGCNGLLPQTVTQQPSGLNESLTWDCNGGVTTSTADVNGQILHTNYVVNNAADPLWRPLGTTDPLGNAALDAYSPTTSESSMLFNAGNSIVDDLTTYDGMGRPSLQQVREAPGSTSFDTVVTTYDSLGREATTSLPCVSTASMPCASPVNTTTTYDALDRPIQIADAGGGYTKYSYTPTGSVLDTLITIGPNPAGENPKKRQLEYDGLGRLSSVCELTNTFGSVTCGQGNSQTGFWTRYKYDGLGRLVGVCENTTVPVNTDCVASPSSGQQTRTFAYDGLGRLTSETNPENGTTTYTHDADATCGTYNGDLVKKLDANGNTICYSYDSLHRLLATTYSGPNSTGVNRYFVYDSATVNGQMMANPKGRLVEAYTATCSTCSKITDEGFSYSARGELSNLYESTPHSGGYYSVPLTYWENGLTKTVGPFLGIGQVGYTPDPEGRMNGTTDGFNPSTTYNAAGQPTQTMTSCHGGTCYPVSWTYDPNTLRMTQYSAAVTSSGSNYTVSGTLTWNPDGSLAKLVISDPLNSLDSQTCTYSADDLGRIASANCGSAWSQTFSYDPFGNITKSGSISWMPGYNSSTNRYTLAGSSYDANGNVLQDTFNTNTFDAEGKVLTTLYPNSQNWQFTYDAFGHVVELSISGAYEYSYVKVGGFKLSAVGQTAGYSQFPLPNGLIKSVGGGGTGYSLTDWLGSWRAFYSYTGGGYGGSGAHAPFGEFYGSTGYPGPFAGVGELGWGLEGDGRSTNTTYWFPERQYRSSQGRWLTPDPAGTDAVDPTNPQSWNKYAYVLNHPMSAIDPQGLDCMYDNGNGTYNSKTGDCVRESDNGFYVDCDGCIGNHMNVPYDAQANADVSALPTSEDIRDFFNLWWDGGGPAEIDYGPNDGWTRGLATTNTFDQYRQTYRQMGCPTGRIPGGSHVLPWFEGYVEHPFGRQALKQVGGFSAYGSTTGNITTFTITNVASNSSFLGETTWAPAINKATGASWNPPPFLPPSGTLMPLSFPWIDPNGLDNPDGPNGARHNIFQKFTWTEKNVCGGG